MDEIINKELQDIPVDEIDCHPSNARDGDEEAIMESIRENGFYGALLVQESTGYIIVGNHRYRAAVRLGYKTIPGIIVDVDDDRARRILLADNRTNDLAGYDEAKLIQLFDYLADTEDDLSGTAWTDEQAEELRKELNPDPPDDFPEVDMEIETDYKCPKCGYEWSGSPR